MVPSNKMRKRRGLRDKSTGWMKESGFLLRHVKLEVLLDIQLAVSPGQADT